MGPAPYRDFGNVFMPLRSPTLGLLAAASLLVLPLSGAHAADLDENYGYAEAPQNVPVPDLPQTKVEFGTGWYVRGDLGVDRLPDMNVSTPATGQAPQTTISQGAKVGYTASLGAGYAFTNMFRADVTADFHQPTTFRRAGGNFPATSTNGYTNNNGTCQLGYAGYSQNGTTLLYQPYYENCASNYQASITSFDVLVNGYVDIGHWSIVTPYVGAGVGLSFGHYSSAVAYYNPDGTAYNTTFTVPGAGVSVHGYNDARLNGNYYNPAFALMAGVAIDLLPHVKLDLGYRYTYLGKVLNATISTQEARAGLRYMIDN